MLEWSKRVRQRAYHNFAAHFAVHDARYRAVLLAAAPLIFAAIAVALGKDTGWDLQNYHWYNPYAWLQDRLGFDLAVAHHATYYNPLADIPFFWIASHGPAWLTGAYLGALFGIAVALIGAIAYQAIACTNPLWRVAIATLLAIAGAIGGGAFPAVGGTSNDVPAAIGIFAGLWLLLWGFAHLRRAEFSKQAAGIALLAGVCAGMSVGLKLTTATYALGLALATAVIPTHWKKRSSNVLLLGIGMVLGLAVCGGFWFWRMWEYGQNPFFPYFNQWFQSPLLTGASYRDLTFVDAHDWLDKLVLPWLFTIDSRHVAEWSFRDARILAAYVLIPLSLIVSMRRKQPESETIPGVANFLFCFAAVAYLAWLKLFSIYRYLIPLEMLAPLLIALAILLWPVALRKRIAIIVIVLLACQAVVSTGLERNRWDTSYISVRQPPLSDPHNTMILMSGKSPMAFVIPSFPRNIPFLRIDGWTVSAADRSSGLAQQMHTRVAQHTGPLLLLFSKNEQGDADAAARAYDLRLLSDSCQEVRSNITEPLQLCALQKTTDGAASIEGDAGTPGGA